MRRNWMPLYIPDFIADTVHLSAKETGAYLCLIFDYWMHDGLPDDDTKLAAIARVTLPAWRKMRPTIEAFFLPGWQHKRIDAELAKMIAKQEARAAAGSKGGTVSSMRRSVAASNAGSKRQANGKQTGQQNDSNRAPHYTSKNITNTTSVAARAREPTGTPTGSEPAEPPAGLAEAEPEAAPNPNVTTELAAAIQRKGWVR